MDVLAALHAVDWRAAGMGDLGRPEGFNRVRSFLAAAHRAAGA